MSDSTPRTEARQSNSKLIRGAIWIAIGSLIAAALVCVVWVLIGDQAGIVGRAFLTILLLAVFAGIAIAESNLASKRPDWLTLASMISWIIALLVGAVKIWLPEEENLYYYDYDGRGVGRFVQLLMVVGVMQLALLHVRLFLKASRRYVTTFTRVIVIVTFSLLALLVAMLVFFLTFPDQFEYGDLYWRIVIALTILVAVGTALIPLLNALFAPRVQTAPHAVAPYGAAPYGSAPHAQQQAGGHSPNASVQPLAPWPTYADGRTPLPVMPDGSPDWNAYYTGYPTYAAPGQGLPPFSTDSQGASGAGSPDASQTAAGQAAPPAPVAPAEPVAPAPTSPADTSRVAPPEPPAFGAFPPPPPAPPGQSAPGKPGNGRTGDGQPGDGR